MSRTNPELWSSIVSKIKAGSKGGKPGQWSARKAQLSTLEYKRRGGGYSGAKTAAQKSLTKWTKEDWKTSDDKPAIRAGGTTRYLPRKAWSKLSSSEKAATNRAKIEGSKRGEQFVANTKAAKEAGRQARRGK